MQIRTLVFLCCGLFLVCFGFSCSDPTCYSDKDCESLQICLQGVCIAKEPLEKEKSVPEKDSSLEKLPEEVAGCPMPAKDCGERGVCKGIVAVCQSNQWVCPYPSDYEEKEETLCDGKDNDCDGEIDENIRKDCYSGDPNVQGQGVCKKGTATCNNGLWSLCTQETLPSAEVCDNLDNNCNGQIDENLTQSCYTGDAKTQNIGSCQSGTQHCKEGKWQTCEKEVLPQKEICDNLDNDCDGQIDNNLTQICYSGDSTKIGIGICRSGTQHCKEGKWQACEKETLPNTEICDNLDNDCNGQIDENLTKRCYAGDPKTQNVGLCKEGLSTCKAGVWGSCANEVLPITEICDNLDNDCDGQIDENLTQKCYTGDSKTQNVGLCKEGLSTCNSGVWGSCVNEVLPITEICDNLDNDCDGQIDENLTKSCYTGDSQKLKIGVCKEGLSTCSAGVWGSCANEVLPTTEICDNLDNDCDGQIDENLTKSCYTGDLKTQNVGLCKEGLSTCNSGVWGSCVNEVLPTTELCDNLDNDCDGQIDQIQTNQACYTGEAQTRKVGLCVDGTKVCEKGNWICKNEFTPLQEECNAKDDDCNGQIDDGVQRQCYTGFMLYSAVWYPETRRNTNTILGKGNGIVGHEWGIPNLPDSRLDYFCKQGTQYCSNGNWGNCVGEILPQREVCDGKDNDCDGYIDVRVCNACMIMSLDPLSRNCDGYQVCNSIDNPQDWSAACTPM